VSRPIFACVRSASGCTTHGPLSLNEITRWADRQATEGSHVEFVDALGNAVHVRRPVPRGEP
jgi:hypothetical protein